MPAIILSLLVLVGIVVLFLLFKFNLFNGGPAKDPRSTAPSLVSSLVV